MKFEFCVACGSEQGLQHHHLVMRSEGGTDDPSNLITLCTECHHKAHSRQMRDAYNRGTLVRAGQARLGADLCKQRQREGIAKARAAGIYKGRRPSIDMAKVRQLKAEGWGPSQVARKLGISRASVYRALEA